MRYTAELAARAEAWLALPLEQKRGGDGSGLRELGAIWATMQGLPPVSCAQCQYSERARDVATYVRDYHRFILSPDTMSDSKYTFAPQYAGETIVHGGYNKAVTAENLTDDDAKALIKLGYGHVIVEKGKAGADTAAAGTGDGDAAPGTSDKKATDAVSKAQKKASDAEAALKTEKEAHKATTKELADTKKALAEANKSLTDTQKQLTETADKLAEATKPEADAS